MRPRLPSGCAVVLRQTAPRIGLWGADRQFPRREQRLTFDYSEISACQCSPSCDLGVTNHTCTATQTLDAVEPFQNAQTLSPPQHCRRQRATITGRRRYSTYPRNPESAGTAGKSASSPAAPPAGGTHRSHWWTKADAKMAAHMRPFGPRVEGKARLRARRCGDRTGAAPPQTGPHRRVSGGRPLSGTGG